MKTIRTLASAVGLAALAVAAAPAFAGWKVAETEHFIYYSEAPEKEVLEAVSRMEKFDTLVRGLTGNTRPSSKLKVVMFELESMDDIARTMPYPADGVGGYYNSTEKGPFLVTFRENVRTGRDSAFKSSKTSFAWGPEVQQHEYLHHYMYQYFNTNYPTWYSEGFAEYYGTMAFPEEWVAEVGHAPFGRLNAIRNSPWLPVKELLTAKSYGDVRDIGALYSQGWLLTHFASQNPERGKQLNQYLRLVATGSTYDEAAEKAFGDLASLDKDLRAHRNDINAMRLSLKPMNFGDIKVRELSPIDDELMYYQIRLSSGFDRQGLPLVVRTVREKIAAATPTSNAYSILAQLEVLDGQFAPAIASADKALALDPKNASALVAKSKAMQGMLTPQSSTEQWEAARVPVREAIALSAYDPEPRMALFHSYLAQGVTPPDEGQNAIIEAFNLLPQNDDIRYLLARDFEQRGNIEDAIAIIEPAAFGTFDGDDSTAKKRRRALGKAAERYTNITDYESARDMLTRLQEKRDAAGTVEAAAETTVSSE